MRCGYTYICSTTGRSLGKWSCIGLNKTGLTALMGSVQGVGKVIKGNGRGEGSGNGEGSRQIGLEGIVNGREKWDG